MTRNVGPNFSKVTDASRVTRLEVINYRLGDLGRVFVVGPDDNLKVELSVQDEGRTLKVFLMDRKG